MNEIYEKLLRCVREVKRKVSFVPSVGLVLGSGLGEYADRIRISDVLPYEQIEGFPISTVQGHAGRFVFGRIGEVPVVCMQGRVHYYEGYAMSDVVLPIRLMGLLGAKTLFLTNAAGGMQPGMQPGDLMLITDQISCFVPSPLIGPNEEELGLRFPDMSRIYDQNLCSLARQAASDLSIPLKEGVYLQLSGPQYETPAEVRMCRLLGADAVGMSTCVEAIAASHMGLSVLGISCITDLAAGITKETVSHDQVQAVADAASPRLSALLDEVIGRLPISEDAADFGRKSHGSAADFHGKKP